MDPSATLDSRSALLFCEETVPRQETKHSARRTWQPVLNQHVCGCEAAVQRVPAAQFAWLVHAAQRRNDTHLASLKEMVQGALEEQADHVALPSRQVVQLDSDGTLHFFQTDLVQCKRGAKKYKADATKARPNMRITQR